MDLRKPTKPNRKYEEDYVLPKQKKNNRNTNMNTNEGIACGSDTNNADNNVETSETNINDPPSNVFGSSENNNRAAMTDTTADANTSENRRSASSQLQAPDTDTVTIVVLNENTDTQHTLAVQTDTDNGISIDTSGVDNINEQLDSLSSHSNQPPAICKPIWMEMLLSHIQQNNTYLANKIDQNNIDLKAEMSSQLNQNNADLKAEMSSQLNQNNADLKSEMSQLNQNNADLKSEMSSQLNHTRKQIEIINSKLSDTTKQVTNQINTLSEQVNDSIKTLADTIDDRIENLAITVLNNTEDIKVIKISQEQTDIKMSQMKHEIKSQLSQSLITMQHDTKLEIESHYSDVENKIAEQIGYIENKLSNLVIDHQTSNKEQIGNIQSEISDHVEQLIKHTENRILPITLQQSEQIANHTSQLGLLNITLSEQRDEVEDIKNQLKQTNNGSLPANIYVTCPGNNTFYSDIPLPKFFGKLNNPDNFLNKLKRYYERNLASNPQKDPYELLIDTVEMSMESHAAKWFSLVKQHITSWNDFEEIFRSKYWSREAQRATKQKVEQDRYREDGKLTRAEYFVERVVLLKSISPPMLEEEIVICLMGHFSQTIQDAIRVQNVRTIQELELLLQREDLRSHHTRPKFSSTRTSPVHSQPQRSQTNNPYNRPAPRPHYDGDRPPTSHIAYPPRSYNQSDHPYQRPHFHPYENRRQQDQYPRNVNHDGRRPTQPTSSQWRNDHPYTPPHRHSENWRYPTREQTQLCTAVIEKQPTTNI